MSRSFNLKAETGVFRITDNTMSITIESNYLFYSNRKKVSELLCKDKLDQNDIIDIFIGLHIVLELGINNVFRKIITPTLQKKISTHTMIENLDNINFIDKIVMFLYYSKFNFIDIDKATEYHKLIEKLRSFSEMRNKLLHGHSIMEVSGEKGISKSKLKKNLNTEKLQEQLKNFKFIVDGLCYYLDCVDSDWTVEGRKQLKETYLSHSFIPKVMKVLGNSSI